MDQFSSEPMNPELDDASQRNGGRDSLFLQAMILIGGDSTSVRVRNLSPGGLMAELSKPVAVDTPLTVEMRGLGIIAGRIAWYTDGRAGIAFDHEIDPLAARKPVGRPRRG